MNSMRGENQPTQLIIHNDDDTPDQFVMDLLRQVFGKSDREATALITQIEQKEKRFADLTRNRLPKPFSNLRNNPSNWPATNCRSR